MSNIAEGFENQSRQQFIRYLYIARGSNGELRSQLYVALDVGYISSTMMKDLKTKATSISKQCSGLIRYLEGYRPPSDQVQEPEANEFYKIITKYYAED